MQYIMRTIATDVARIAWSVCVLVTQMCSAKTAELIEMPFESPLVTTGNPKADSCI